MPSKPRLFKTCWPSKGTGPLTCKPLSAPGTMLLAMTPKGSSNGSQSTMFKGGFTQGLPPMTVMVKLQQFVRWHRSTTQQVTVLVPIGKNEPEGGLHVMMTSVGSTGTVVVGGG